MKPKIQGTEKIAGHHLYRRLGNGAANCARFGDSYFQLVRHKNQIRALLLRDKEKQFHTSQVISPSEARRLIAWLARYIAYSDPDPVSLAIAETKAHAHGILRSQEQIAKELGLNK